GPGHAGPRGDRHRPGHPARPGAERDHAAAGLAAVAAHADDVCPAAVGAAVGAAEPGAGPGRDPAPPRPAVPEAVPATADPVDHAERPRVGSEPGPDPHVEGLGFPGPAAVRARLGAAAHLGAPVPGAPVPGAPVV